MRIFRFFRLYTIQKTLLKYGLDELIPKKWFPWYARVLRMSLFWIRNQHTHAPRGERIRLALQSLGPVFIKFGQMLSTRRDLIPKDIADQLAILQDHVAPFSGELAKTNIERALGIADISDLFTDFEIEPIASASIAQVHGAKLIENQQEVVIKVIRPGIEQTIKADIALMQSLAEIMQFILPDGKRLKPIEVVEEYKKTIFDELDLLREAGNGIQLRQNFLNSDDLYVPDIYPDYCRKQVLVMERIKGIPVTQVETLRDMGVDLEKLAEMGVRVFFTQVFRDSFFHADMHPGNIFVSVEHPDKPKYIAIDFGIVGTLHSEDKRYLAENFVAFFNRDYRKVAQLHVDSGWVPATTNVDEFEVAIRSVCDPIFQKPLEEISFGHVLVQLFNTARRFHMEVQPQLVLLQKTLLYIEGLGRQLYPKLDLWKTAKPFLEDWVNEQIGFKAMFRKIKSNAPYWSEKLPEVPDLVFDTLTQIKHWPANQHLMMQHIAESQQTQTKTIFYGLLGLAAAILCSFTFAVHQHMTWVALSGGLSLFAWIKAWRLSHKQTSSKTNF